MSSTAPHTAPSGSVEPASVDSTASAEVVPPTDTSPSIRRRASDIDCLADEAVSDVVSDAEGEVQKQKLTTTSMSSTEGSEQPSPKQRQERKRSKNAGRITHREEREKYHQSALSSSRSSSSKGKKPLGESAGIAFLLSNHALFGLAERICYHFDLIETLRRSGEGDDDDKVEEGGGGRGNDVKEDGTCRGGRVASTASQQNQTFAAATSAGNGFCGVSSLLECVPLIPPNKQTKKLRRLLKNRVKEFNLEARLFRSACSSGSSGTTGPRCYQPPSLPLRPKPTTRVTFAYEMTSLVICLDASSTVTSTFGNLGVSATDSSSFGIGDDGAICALDRFGGMVRRYLTALVEPVPAVSAINSRGDGTGRNRGDTTTNSAGSNTGSTSSCWMPELRVTVLATFPKASSYVLDESGSELGRTSLLVRDYRVTDLQSAEELASAVQDWALSKVEGIIASRLSQAGGRSNDRVDSMSSSSLRDLLEICDDALASTLPPEGRPAVVLATDCRSVDCQSVLETLGNTRRTDVPIHVLDLSSSHSHSVSGVTSRTRSMDKGNRPSASDQLPIMQHSITNDYLTFDDAGPETFPLGMSDDAEALYDVCRATGGCFIDSLLLEEASRITAGHVPSDSVFHGDHYLAFRRRALRPNALQWYTIFCLSPLTPLYNSSWGRLPPPVFLRRGKSTSPNFDQSPLLSSLSPSSTLLRQQNQFVRRGAQARTVFSVYAISPVRVKSILIMRLIEGFRARKYGLNTRDEDKISVHLTVPLEFGIVVHYEFSYVASPFYNVLVGSAHVKIELSGDPSFIQSVKNDFINHQVGQMRDQGTISQRISAQLCKFLRYVRKEDAFDSYLTPREWSVQLQPGSNFLRRLGIMSSVQRHRHFDVDSSIEVVCVGGDPFSNQESLLSEFIQEENGENELFEAIEQFSTQTIIDRDCYIKQLPSSRRDLVMYCLINVKQSSEAARLFSVTLEFFGCQDERERIAIVQDLRDRLRSCATSLVLLPRRVSRYLHMLKQRKAGNVERSQSFLHRAHWTLIKDDDLIAVICQRRRSSIGNFMLLDSSTTHALLGKFVSSKTLVQGRERSSLNLVLYHIRTSSTKDHVSVDIYMETERGFLNPFNFSPRSPTKPMFYEFFERVKRRDEECSLALRSRRRLLSVFGNPNEIRLRTESATGEVEELFAVSEEEQEEDLCRLLVYANTSTKHLRFFKDGSGVANDALATFTAESILSSTISGSTDIAELKIDLTKTVGTCKEGRWFLIRHDKNTMTFLHFALSNESLGPDEGIDAGAQMIRRLTFHTVYSADLYQTKDDFDDGDEEEEGEEEHAEHLGVTEFAERIERTHSKNYASALYLALRTKGEDTAAVGKIDSSDFEFATRSCLDEVKVTDVYITATSSLNGNEKAVPSDDSSLPALILSMFEPVPVDNESQYFYYKGDEAFDDEQIFDYHPSGQDRIHDLTVPYSGIMSDGGNDDSASQSSPVKIDDDVMSFSSEEENEDEQIAFIGDLARSTSVDTSHVDSLFSSVDPPILVRFLLDGRDASVKELTEMHSSSTLSVLMTVFREVIVGTSMPGRQLISEPSYRLPRLHAAVALKTASKLKSFVAEQQLERLRQIGWQISEIDLRSVLYQLSLLESKRVASSQVLLEFFVPGNDELVSASAPTGNEKSLENFFTLLSSEIGKQTIVKLKTITEGSGDFLVVSEGDSALPFWCFIQLQKGLGRILINVHHSDGFDRATEIAARTTAAIKQVCRRVNQILLLESLHRTRHASYMLIKEDDDGKTASNVRKNTDEESREDLHRHGDQSHHRRRHLQGEFACTVKFQRSFFLFHRCSRKTAVMALESKVLHNFAVSNRRGLFVYKDEVDHVFYMRLSSFVNADGSEGILLFVHGVEMPGPSITTELCRLLERMLFSISLEALSSVLTKNPFYPLLPVDIAFVRDFQSQWTAITENDESILSAPHDNERTYEFPIGVDPMLVLMYFRQNICGSGFFHHLNEADVEASDTDTDVSISTTDCDDKGGIVLPFDKSHFSLFYNNSPSQVDPHYQPVSTLTKRGDQYRKKSGTGIALVEIELLDGNGSIVNSIRTGDFAQPKNCVDRINYSSELLRMRRIFDESKEGISPVSPAAAFRNYRVHIRIVNTLLDARILHSWIELSLNQALVGFRIEAVLMESHRAISVSSNFNAVADEKSNLVPGWRRGPNPNVALICSRDVDSLCKGIPGLHSIISSSYDLPHPAVVKSELRKIPVKATLLAPLTLSLLDGLTHDLQLERRGSCDAFRGGVVIIRTTPTDKARLVAIDRGASAGSVRVTEYNTDGRSRKLFDRVTDSPEYIAAFGLGHSREKEEDDGTDKKRRSSVLRSRLVFRELVVEDPSENSFAKRLHDLKSLRPDLFQRSLAFILHVTRSSRSLYVYNWNQASLSNVISRMESIENEIIQSDQQLSQKQQAKYLRGLNLFNDHEETGPQTGSSVQSKKAAKLQVETNKLGGTRPAASEHEHSLAKIQPKASGPTAPPPRKIRRPTNILRPTLIGKSVEGSAMQALAASRARASSRTVPGQIRPQPIATTGRQSTKSRKERQSISEAASNKKPTKSSAMKPKKEATLSARKEVVGESEETGTSTTHGRKALGHKRPQSVRQHQRAGSIPPKLAKDFFLVLRTKYCTAILKRRIPMSRAQQLAGMLMTHVQSQKSNFDELYYMSRHSIPLFSSSCELSPCAADQAMPFLSFISERIVKTNSSASILSIENSPRPLTYVRQDLAGSRSCRAILFVQLAVTRHSTTQQLIGRASGWLFICPPSVTAPRVKKRKKKARRSTGRSSGKITKRPTKALSKLEKTSSSLYSATTCYRENLHMRSEFFNFIGTILMKLDPLGSLETMASTPDSLQMLKTMFYEYPPFLQRELPQTNYRLLHDILQVGNFAHAEEPISFDAGHFFGYLCSNLPDGWGIIECSKSNQRLLVGDIVREDVPTARFFLVCSNSTGITFEIFLLCPGDGGTLLDEYVVSPDQIYAERLQAKILRLACETINEVMRLSAISLRRDTLWATLSLEHNRDASGISSKDVREMCQLCSQTSLFDIDPRLSDLLDLNDDDHVGIRWQNVLFSMKQDPLIFSHCLAVQMPERNSMAHLFHFAKNDMFVCFELSSDTGKMLAANLLLRVETKGDEAVAASRKCKALELVTNWIVHFVWHNL